MIPYATQDITEDDIAAVNAVLHSPLITQGHVVTEFERAICDYCGAQYATAVNSATSALHLACLALGLKPGDHLWTTAVSFVASANCGRYCGASIDFIDIDPVTYNLSVSALETRLEQAQQEGALPKIVVVVHLAGQSCDMQSIHALSQQYGFSIIEDASHAIGGQYRGTPIGRCQYSDICVFSFHPVKIITTGEGGIAVTNQAGLAISMARLRSHGITKDQDEFLHPSDAPWHYEQQALGFNYRLTDFQAALGISQLKRLDQYINERHRLAERYTQAFQHLSLTLPYIAPDCYSTFHLYIVLVPLKQGLDHLAIFNGLRQMGIGVNLHYIPIYKQPYYRTLGFPTDYCPNAEHYYKQAITLPLFPSLSDEQQDYVIEAVSSLLKSKVQQ